MRQQITEEYLTQLTKMNVVGLDPAAQICFYNPIENGVEWGPNTENAP